MNIQFGNRLATTPVPVKDPERFLNPGDIIAFNVPATKGYDPYELTDRSKDVPLRHDPQYAQVKGRTEEGDILAVPLANATKTAKETGNDTFTLILQNSDPEQGK